MPKKLLAGIFLFAALIFTQSASAQTYSKLPNGIEVPLTNPKCFLRIEVIDNGIIHVVKSPFGKPSYKSLMVNYKGNQPVTFTAVSAKNEVNLKTSKLWLVISPSDGSIRYQDLSGKLLTSAGRNFNELAPVSNGGEASYKLKQSFSVTDDEAFYGLGQHQDGLMNYKGYQVNLLQYNTDVAVPFLVSNKNYGILWDNYSITQVGDTRPYQPLSGLQLFSKSGEEGWLTATYSSLKDSSKIFIQRPESDIDYSFLKDQRKFPDSVKLAESKVTYDGSIASAYSGVHKFHIKYSGYIKVWVADKLLVDKWRQAWNPGSQIFDVNLQKGQKQPIRIEWNPDGSEAYLSINWLSPQTEAERRQVSFASESGDAIDYYFVAGKNTDDVIHGYRELTGKATMLPKWAFGFWQSRERYKTQDEIISTISEFRKRQIPIDNIVLDWSYWKQDEWGSQDFDPARFPDPSKMIKSVHDDYHAHFMISVWPKFYPGTANYDFMNKNGWLYKRNIADGRRDWIAGGYKNTFYDAYNPQARSAMWDLMNKHLYSKGIDAWWMDASEPDIHSNLDVEARKSIFTPTYLGSSTKYFNGYALENARGIYEGQRKTNPDSRIFTLTRSAYGGLQRYAAATWSGDIASRWEDFKAQIPAGINFSLSGIPYWTMDIGGFSVERRYEKPTDKDLDEWRELNARWYQFGAFVPLFRQHGQYPYREIYNIAPEGHPAYSSMLFYNKLRYRLMPYIYSLAGKVYQDDYTMMRGLVMDFSSDPAVNNIADQYMFGPSLLINPVTDYHAKSREVYLPKGSDWFDLYSGKYYIGGNKISADAPYERMPVFVKEGSIIPFGPAIQYTSEKPADVITLYVYTGKDASFDLYEDEGTNYNYEKGHYAVIPMKYDEVTHQLTIGPRKGSFNGMLQSRGFRVVWISKTSGSSLDFDQQKAQSIKYDGKEIKVKSAQ